MNDQNQAVASASEGQPLKRKRGRPRWDDNINQGNSSSSDQGWEESGANESSEEEEPSEQMEDNLSGQVVSGVLNGSFDAGYFISVKLRNMDTILTGLVFCPEKVVSITSENDVAPEAKMYTRKNYDITNLSPPNQFDAQTQQIEIDNQLALQLGNQTLTSVNQSADNQRPSSLPGKIGSKLAALRPPFDPVNASNSLKGHDISYQGLDIGVGNLYTTDEQLQDYGIADHDEIMREFEASACMNAPRMSVQQFDFPENLINGEVSQNQEAAILDSSTKLNASGQLDKEMENEGSSHVVGPGCSRFTQPISCSADAAGFGSKINNQDIFFDINEMPSIDDATRRQVIADYHCLKTSGSSGKELPSSASEKNNLDKASAAPFFENLANTSTQSATTASLTSFMMIDFTFNNPTQEADSSDLVLSATGTLQVISSPRDHDGHYNDKAPST